MIDLHLDRSHLYAAKKLEVSAQRDGKSLDHRNGTGFIVEATENHFALVTNRHVVDHAYTDSDRIRTTITSVKVTGYHSEDMEHHRSWRVAEPDVVYPDGDEDVAIIDIDEDRCSGDIGLTDVIKHELLARETAFNTNDRVNAILPSDLIAIPGFPEMLPGLQAERPMINIGFISSDPAHPPLPIPNIVHLDRQSSSPIRGSRIVLYQGFSRSGLSGSPVIATQRGIQFGDWNRNPMARKVSIIGVNAGRIQGTHSNPSALSYFVRSDAILEALQKLRPAT